MLQYDYKLFVVYSLSVRLLKASNKSTLFQQTILLFFKKLVDKQLKKTINGILLLKQQTFKNQA